MTTMANLAHDTEDILTNYSQGTLPMPTYVTLSTHGAGLIKLCMNSEAEVQRWAEAVDAEAKHTPWRSSDDGVTIDHQVHHTVGFKHGEVWVEVFHVEHV